MAIVKGHRTDRAIRRPLRPNEKEGVHWYRKVDPDFDRFMYSRCHRTLRRAIRQDDIVFFRTLWRGRQHIIGYFTVSVSMEPENDPVIMASSQYSRLIHFLLPLTPAMVRRLNPRAPGKRTRPLNQWINEWLGRNWMRLDRQAAAYLKTRVDASAASS